MSGRYVEGPLSSLQAGMLVHLAREGSAGVDVQQVVGWAQQGFDAPRLAAAFTETTARRDALRAVFRLDSLEAPTLRIQDSPPELNHHDWRSTSKDELETEFHRWRNQDRNRTFELEVRPPSRFTTFDLGEGRGLFCWTFHHLLLDGRSIPLVLDDLFRIYFQRPLPAEAPSWLAHLRRAASDPRGQDLEALRSRIADVEESTPLDMGIPSRSPIMEPDPRAVSIEAGPESELLAAAARRFGVTPGTFVHAAWALLLSRYADREEVIFGTTRAGRACFGPDVSELAGMLINTIPLRVDCSREQSLGSWLRALRAEQVAQRAFERIDLADAAALTRLPPGSPLFESLVVVDGATVDLRMRNRDLPLEAWRFEYFGQTNYPLTLAAYLQPRLRLRLEYEPGRIDAESARRLLVHFRGLLGHLLEAHPDAPLGSVPLLSETEREWLVFGLNATETPVPLHGELHHPFLRRAHEHPEAPALICRGETLTYSALRNRSAAVARRLLEAGLERGDLVAVSLPRGFDLVASLLGVLEAGGVYVPIDPTYPLERRRFLIEDSEARFVLAADQPLTRDEGCPPLLRVDVPGPEGSTAPPYRPPREPDDLAYVIYTSGSTGRPKGVAVSHRSALNLIDWVNRSFAVSRKDHLLFVTSPCFDLSVYDLFGILAAGGRITIATEDELESPETLLRYLEEGGVTFWDSAPGALDRLLPLAKPAPQSKLRLAFLSGDWIPVRLPDELRAYHPEVEIVGLGGATEATVWSNAYRVGEVDSRWPSIPYGRPIQNARYLVLDRHLDPMAIGAPGDLYIGGTCLAAGYHRRPELTQERFLPDPFRPGERLYKTGDRARVLPSGDLEFLGRQDGQVKIRGFRVELGEVTATLDLHPGVESAVVTVAGEQDSRRLVAFVSSPEGDEGSEDLEDFLAQQLPSHMVPSRVVTVPEIPLTPNGKVDYPSLVGGLEEEITAADDLENDEEVHVALLWERLLGRRPRRSDDFFRCGGNSVLAIRMMAELQRTVGSKVFLPELFRSPTVAGIARALRADPGRSPRATLLPLSDEGAGPPLYLLLGVFHYYALARHLAPDLNPTGMVVPTEQRILEAPDRRVSVEDLAAEYVRLIEAHHPGGPIFLGGLSFGGLLAFEAARQLQQQGWQVGQVILLDTLPSRFLRQSRVQSAIRRLLPPRSPSVTRILQSFRPAREFGPGDRPAYRAAAERYDARPSTLRGPATLIRAKDSFADLRAPADLGWGARVAGPLRLETVPGGHLSMLQDPHVERVAELVKSACLTAAADRNVS